MRKYQVHTLSSSTAQVHDNTIQTISQIVYNLHNHLVSITKCPNNYRYLTPQQEQLLKITQNHNEYHTLLAGVLAVDSCIRNMVQKQNQYQNKMMKTLYQVIKQYIRRDKEKENLQREKDKNAKDNSSGLDLIQHLVQHVGMLMYVNEKQIQKCMKLLEYPQDVDEMIAPRRFLIATLKEQNKELKRELDELSAKTIKLEDKLLKCLEQYEDKGYNQIDKQIKMRLKQVERQNQNFRKVINLNFIEKFEELESEVGSLKQKRRKDMRKFKEIQKKMEEVSLTQINEGKRENRFSKDKNGKYNALYN